MKQRHTPYVTLALVALATAFLAAAAEVEPLKNDESRTQGFRLDAKHELRMEDHNGAVRLNLLTRTREAAAGDTAATASEGGRETDIATLLEVYSEVVMPSAPNYWQNPGKTYRIIVRGLDLDPGYVSVTEARAEEARKVVFREFERFMPFADDIEKDALHYGLPLVLGILNDDNRLPAQIYETALRSKSMRARLTEDEQQQRKSVLRPRSLEPDRPGQTPPEAPNAGKAGAPRGMSLDGKSLILLE